MTRVPWSYLYYDHAVKLAIETLDSGHLADLGLAKQILETFGPHDLPSKLSKPMGGGLFEFRLSGFETKERVFYCYLSGKRLVFLHVFTKTTQKTPPKELKLAQARYAEIVQAERGNEKSKREGRDARRQ